MPNFQVNRKCKIREDVVSPKTVALAVKDDLSKYYYPQDIVVTEAGSIIVKGDLSGDWEGGVTTAEVSIKIADGQLTYRVDGRSALGKSTWVWFILGFVVVFCFIGFALNLIEYLISKDRPKQVFEEVFQSIQARFE